jgi:hypothetical protein
MRRAWFAFTVAALAAAVFCPPSRAADKEKAKAKKIVLLGMKRDHGKGEHEYMAGLKILAECLKQTPGVEPVVVRVDFNDKRLPKQAKVIEGASAVVIFMRAGGDYFMQNGARREALQAVLKKGAGFVALHWAVEGQKKIGDPYMAVLGGYYEPGHSDNPHNTTTVRPADPKHPIARGWKPFEARDEFYFKIRLREGAKPAILADRLVGHDKKTYKDQTIGWV